MPHSLYLLRGFFPHFPHFLHPGLSSSWLTRLISRLMTLLGAIHSFRFLCPLLCVTLKQFSVNSFLHYSSSSKICLCLLRILLISGNMGSKSVTKLILGLLLWSVFFFPLSAKCLLILNALKKARLTCSS